MRDYDQNQPVAEEQRSVYEVTMPVESIDIQKREVRPTQDYLRDYEISIRFLSLGCIVRIGCKEIAFASTAEAMGEVNDYVNNPESSIQKYNKLFNK
jgi:hypothetical protein